MSKIKYNYKNLMENFTTSCGVCGYSEETASIFKNYAEALDIIVGVDITGSVSALLRGKVCPINSGYKRRILIIANQDNPGFLIKGGCKDRGYKLYKIGDLNIEPNKVFNGQLLVKDNRIDVRIQNKDKEFFIKLDPNDVIDEELKGSPIMIYSKLNTNIMGKYGGPSIGIKASLLSLCITMGAMNTDILYDDLYFVAASLNSLNSCGSRMCTDKINPTIAIDIGAFKYDKKKFLGKGPVILNSPLTNKKLFQLIVEVAKKNNIKYQIEVSNGDSNPNINRMVYTAGGVACCSIMLPVYGQYTNNEIVSKADINNCSKLVNKIIIEINKIDSFLPEV